MSIGPITKSSPRSSAGLLVAGVALLIQAALRAFVLAAFLSALSRSQRLSQVIFGSVYMLSMSIVVPVALLVAGAVVGLMLLARFRIAAVLAGLFCILGLLVQAFSALGIAVAYTRTSHHPPTQTFVLMALNAAIYLGVLAAVARAA